MPVPAGEIVVLTVRGMSCAACAVRLERVLSGAAGIEAASVDLVTARATVQARSGAVDVEAVRSLVAGAGFEAQALTRTASPVHEAEPSVLPKAVLALVVGMVLMGLGEAAASRPVQLGMLTVATAVQAWAGSSFYGGAWRAARARAFDMNTLVALAISAAWAVSAFVTLMPEAAARHQMGAELYYEPALMIVGLVLLGRALEAQARARVGASINALVRLQPRVAHRVEGDVDHDVPVEALRVGDLVRVRPGEQVPVDGVVALGTCVVGEALLTGEPLGVPKSAGDPVTGGTCNGTTAFVLRATRVGEHTTLAEIVRRVERARTEKAPIQQLADRVAGAFVPAVLGLAALTWALWMVFGPEPQLVQALRSAIAVLIVACPCALGLATPTALLVGVAHAAERGVLIRGGQGLEAAGRVTAVVFDKTGTLTLGRPEVVEVLAVEGDRNTLLALAAAAERGSEHPLGEALRAHAAALHLTVPPSEDFVARPGRGGSARVGGRSVLLGSSLLLEEAGVDVAALAEPARQLAATGATLVFIAVDGVVAGLIAARDPVKPDAAQAVAALHAQGLEVWMMTGDSPGAALAVAEAVGIPAQRVAAGLLPGHKEDRVTALREAGAVVAMVGDGINDAQALARADLGIALGAGTEVAVAASDITVVGGRVHGVVAALAMSRRTLRIIRQNLVWAFGYNALLIPVAMGALYPWTGLRLSPLLCAVAMSFSSVSVVANALRLRHDTWEEAVTAALTALARLDGGYVFGTQR